MNKKCFRVIFSKTQQCLVAVSEISKSDCKSSSNTPEGAGACTSVMNTLKPVAFGLFCALGFVSLSSVASANALTIQADRTAPKHQQATVSTVGQSVQLVNIQAPNSRGLSHNKYHQFNVDTQGAILNNSRHGANTQLAGNVAANPHLARGEARVILNEVTSNNPSTLKGYVEVAGKKAEVIIANPNGLHCDGCGVINASRATFTTGKPKMINGHLDSFVVEKGKITVSGKGMDNRQTDYTEIIARSNEINAEIWSKKEILVMGGKVGGSSSNQQDVQIIHSKNKKATQTHEAKPQFAVDVGQLGGMYAEKIHLIGTEAGLGVRNAGQLGASLNNVQINAKGKIINKGEIVAQQEVRLQGQLDNTLGKIESKASTVYINSKEQVNNTKGLIRADKGVVVNANGVMNRQGLIKGETVKVNSYGAVVNNTQGAIEANKGIYIDGRLNNFEGKVASETASAVIDSDTQVNNTKGVIKGSTVTVSAKGITNNQGLIKGDVVALDSKGSTTNNIQGTIDSQVTLVKTKGLLNNQGLITGKAVVIESKGAVVDNHRGTISGNEGVYINGRLNNLEGKIVSQQSGVIIQSDAQLDNTKGVISAAKTALVVAQGLTNTQGLINADSVEVNGKLHGALTTKTVVVDTKALGVVVAKHVTVNDVKQYEIDNTQGAIVATKNIYLNGKLSNFEGKIASEFGNVNVYSRNETDNTKGTVRAAGNVTIQSQGLTNYQGLVDGKNVVVNSNGYSVDNMLGTVRAVQNVCMIAQDVANYQGLISGKNVAVNTKNGGIDNTLGTIEVEKTVSLVGNLNNTDGRVMYKSTTK